MMTIELVALSLTNKELPFPFIRFIIDGDFEPSVPIVPEPGLDTDGSVDVHHSPNHGFRVESTGDSVIRVETGTGDVDDGTAQHVTTFWGEHQREVCTICETK